MLPRTLRSPAERREYLVAFAMVGILQGALGVALLVCAAQTWRMWRAGVPYLPGELGRLVPVCLAGGGVLALAATLRSLGRIRTVRAIPLDPDPDR